MSIRRVSVLQVGLLLAAMFANAASQKDTVQITVLDSVTRVSTSDSNNGVPQNCEQLTYDAYCRSTTNPPMISTLLVQEGNEPPFRISCTIESRYSRCIPLPKGESFDARKEKRGLTVYYVDEKGKERKQLYTLVDAGGKAGPLAAATAFAVQPVAASPRHGRVLLRPRQPHPRRLTGASPTVGSVQAVPPEKSGESKVQFQLYAAGCGNHTRRKVRGQHAIGNPVSAGTHGVVFSMPGFAEWKRELTVEAGSVVNVTAILQKTQP